MIVRIKCDYCESEDLSLIDVIYGEGTVEKRTERAFKCNSCDETLDLDEVIVEELYNK